MKIAISIADFLSAFPAEVWCGTGKQLFHGAMEWGNIPEAIA